MHAIVIIIVLIIIMLQIHFFSKNVKRMKEYKEIFKNEDSWSILHHPDTNFVTGIYGEGNYIFEAIKESINKYLGNSSGSVIDYSLLKDAIDRHCDSVENDVHTLTPVPLYCGLAGTMAGVIIGLGSLLMTGSITDLLSSGSGSFGSAANGVNDLLSGVAWAMIASISGIYFTTRASILLKKYKLEGEAGKNNFMAWLQAVLLPELPSDTSDALNKLVKNLNKFNNTFATNTSSLRSALSEVNESYRIQGDVIKAVHDMDVMKMAKANVRVLQELKECTDKLELFNEYLDDIQGYTDAIHKFTSLFEQESNRLHVLEEIQQYFMRHKAEITKDSADLDLALRKSLEAINDTACSNSQKLSSTLVEQAEAFKRIIKEEKESFEQISNEIKAQFSSQLGHIPMLEKQLAEISQIPAMLNSMISEIKRSNGILATQTNEALNMVSKKLSSSSPKVTSGEGGTVHQLLPDWMKWPIFVSIMVIALSCLYYVSKNIFFDANINNPAVVVDNGKDEFIEESAPELKDTTSISRDTAKRIIQMPITSIKPSPFDDYTGSKPTTSNEILKKPTNQYGKK